MISSEFLSVFKSKQKTTKIAKHIFIVEDNEIYYRMQDYILSKESIYQFISFNSGEDCIRNLNLNPDVIILDYKLPGMNGYDALLEIKKQKPAIHVVMLTGDRDGILGEELIRAGADDHVLKEDYGDEQTIEKIETILTKNKLGRNSFMEIKNKSKSLLEKLFN